jgi:hypothetical protein
MNRQRVCRLAAAAGALVLAGMLGGCVYGPGYPGYYGGYTYPYGYGYSYAYAPPPVSFNFGWWGGGGHGWGHHDWR